MNGFEVNEAASSAVVVSVAFNSASRKSASLAVTLLAKKRPTKKIDFVVALVPTFQIITQAYPTYSFMADVCKM